MSSGPLFAGASVNVGSALVSATLDTSTTAPTNSVTVVTAGTSGTKIEELVLQATATTSAGVVNIFLYDGTTYHLFDQVQIPAVTYSTTAIGFRWNKKYDNLILPYVSSTAWKLVFTNTVAGNESILTMSAFGGNF